MSLLMRWRRTFFKHHRLFPVTQVMNAARIHDKHKLRSFWEQKIEQQREQMDEEESRMRSSSLPRLREQWLVRLDLRNQHQQSFFEERIRRAQKAHLGFGKIELH